MEGQMTDQELDAVLAATRVIPPERRASFLQALGYALEHSADFGDGVVARTLAAVRREVVGPAFKTTIVWR
jgi:hypothetical protein